MYTKGHVKKLTRGGKTAATKKSNSKRIDQTKIGVNQISKPARHNSPIPSLLSLAARRADPGQVPHRIKLTVRV